jgi:DNA-directed RNA polymerase subunit F
MEILSEQPITDAEAKEILEKREKETELKYEQKNALDILRKFSVYPAEKIKKLVEDLRKIEKLRDKQVIAIANLLPEDKDDLRAILQKDYANLTEDEINLILETVKKA